MTKPHVRQLTPEQHDEIRMLLQDDLDYEGAVERLFEIFPEATRDEICDVANELEGVGL